MLRVDFICVYAACIRYYVGGIEYSARKQVVCDGYRCFLHRDSSARGKTFVFEGQEYEYRYHYIEMFLIINNTN